MLSNIFNKERKIIAGAIAATVGFAGLVLVFKAKERRNRIIQALKDIKKELFPLLSEIAAASSDEHTPAGDYNPFKKTYQERIDQVFEDVLERHELKVDDFNAVCTVEYRKHDCIYGRYKKIIQSIDHAFAKIPPELSCKIPKHFTREAALEVQKNVHKSVLRQVYNEIARFRNEGKKISMTSERFVNTYYKTIWNYDLKKPCYIEQKLDEFEDSADQIRLYALEEYKKDESFKEELEELEDQQQRAVHALLLQDRDAPIFIESIGAHLNNLNKSLNQSIRVSA